MSSICTLIDLELGKLFLESPKCKDKLQISLLENLTHLSAEVDVFGQRYGCIIVYMFTFCYDNSPFHIHLFCHLLFLSYSSCCTICIFAERKSINRSSGCGFLGSLFLHQLASGLFRLILFGDILPSPILRITSALL
jgi:hypothetical protein